MGKKARRERSKVKYLAWLRGFKESELGELRPRLTKAEARRRFIRAWEARMRIQDELLRIISQQAIDDIHAVEDARAFSQLDAMAEAL